MSADGGLVHLCCGRVWRPGQVPNLFRAFEVLVELELKHLSAAFNLKGAEKVLNPHRSFCLNRITDL
jgi:hypothetical protein